MGDGLVIIEVLPLTSDSPVRLVAGNFIDETMSTHQFFHIPIFLVAIDKERLSVNNMPEIFVAAKFPIGELVIDSVARNVLRPVPSLLY